MCVCCFGGGGEGGVVCFVFYFKGQHIGGVMKDDSFPFLIAMVPVAWLPGGDRKGADTNIL